MRGWAEIPELRHHLDWWFRPPRHPPQRIYQLALTGYDSSSWITLKYSQPVLSPSLVTVHLHVPSSLVFPPPTISANKARVSPQAGRYNHIRLCSRLNFGWILFSKRLHFLQWLKTRGFLYWRSQTYSNNNLRCILAEVWRKGVRGRDGGKEQFKKTQRNEITRIKIGIPDYIYDRLASSLI